LRSDDDDDDEEVKMVLKIIRDLFGRTMRRYHVNTTISESHIEHFQAPLRESSEEYLEKLGPIGDALVRELFSIHGVSEVFIRPYEISVIIGEAFEWEDIDPALIEALRRAFGKDAAKEVVVENLGHPFFSAGEEEDAEDEFEPEEDAE
jgi:hypothetical protein